MAHETVLRTVKATQHAPNTPATPLATVRILPSGHIRTIVTARLIRAVLNGNKNISDFVSNYAKEKEKRTTKKSCTGLDTKRAIVSTTNYLKKVGARWVNGMEKKT